MRRFLKKDVGSITLEAAIFMPFFILFLVFLLYMIKFTLIDIAINRATSETAKQIATQLYPAQVLVDEVTVLVEGNERYQSLKEGLENNLGAIEDSLIATLGEDNYSTIKNKAGAKVDEEVHEHVINPLENKFLTDIVQMYLEEADKLNILEKDNATVVNATLPNLFNEESNFVKITTEYVLDLPIPFVKETYSIQKTAAEKAWLGS